MHYHSAAAKWSRYSSYLRQPGLYGENMMKIYSLFIKCAKAGALLLTSLLLLTANAVQAQGSNQYILEAGDRIFVQVFDEPDLTMEAVIAQSGTINYSYLGSITVAGRTPEQLTQILTEKLRDGYLRNPSVNVTVRQYRSFFVDGEVKSPGSYAYEPGLTVAKAVSMGGGLTDRASRRKIFLTREVEGEKRSYKVDMSQTIEPGDVITIREGFF